MSVIELHGLTKRFGELIAVDDVMILDEPANGLDPEGVHWLRELLREIASRGRTVLVSTHGEATTAGPLPFVAASPCSPLSPWPCRCRPPAPPSNVTSPDSSDPHVQQARAP